MGVHAGHAQYEPQDNKFAVFPQFWELPQYAVPSEQIISGRWVRTYPFFLCTLQHAMCMRLARSRLGSQTGAQHAQVIHSLGCAQQHARSHGVLPV